MVQARLLSRVTLFVFYTVFVVAGRTQVLSVGGPAFREQWRALGPKKAIIEKEGVAAIL